MKFRTVHNSRVERFVEYDAFTQTGTVLYADCETGKCSSNAPYPIVDDWDFVRCIRNWIESGSTIVPDWE